MADQKLTAKSQTGDLTDDSLVYAVNDPSGTAVDSKETFGNVGRAGATNPTETGISASTTQTQVAATALTEVVNDVTTVSNDNDAAKLDSASANKKQIVYNNGGAILQLFPASGDNLGEGVDASTTIEPGGFGVFVSKDATNWISTINNNVDYISGVFEEGADDDTTVTLNSPISGTITDTTTKCDSGTATYTFKINSTALGGTANSVSSTEQTQSHSSDNEFAVGDDLVITRSANSSCVKGTFTIRFRT